MNLGLRVAIPPLIGQAAEDFRSIALLEQRPVVAAGGPLGQHVDRRVEPDGNRAIIEQLSRARVHECPAPCRNYAYFAFDQAGDEAPLAIPKIMFAIALEQVRRTRSRCLFDFDIAVHEWQAEA